MNGGLQRCDDSAHRFSIRLRAVFRGAEMQSSSSISLDQAIGCVSDQAIHPFHLSGFSAQDQNFCRQERCDLLKCEFA